MSRNVKQLFKDIKEPEESDETEFQPKTNESIHRDAPSALKIVLNSQAASEPVTYSKPEKLDPKTYCMLFLVLRYDCSLICYCLAITFKIPDGTLAGVWEWLKVNFLTSFDSLITQIHEKLGCSELKQKAKLHYCFDIQGTKAMKLTKKAHWNSLKEDLTSRQKKWKGGTMIS